MSQYEAERAVDDSLKDEWNAFYRGGTEEQRRNAYATQRMLIDKYEPGYGRVKLGLQSACAQPQPFEFDTMICGHCGWRIADHAVEAVRRNRTMRPYEEAVLRWMVRNGGVFNLYGGYDQALSVIVKKHLLEDCELDYAESGAPEVVEESEFAGTFADNDEVKVTSTQLTCRCKKVDEVPWCIREEVSMGQMVWQVIREGEL